MQTSDYRAKQVSLGRETWIQLLIYHARFMRTHLERSRITDRRIASTVPRSFIPRLRRERKNWGLFHTNSLFLKSLLCYSINILKIFKNSPEFNYLETYLYERMKQPVKLLKPLKIQFHYSKIFTLFFISLLLIAIIEDIMLQNWYNLFLSIISLLLIYLPYLLSRKTVIYIPPGFQVIFVLFLYGSIYLGELKSFYFRFWWWDSMLHTFSGIILGLIGFFLLYTLNREENIKVMMSPILLAVFAFTFTVTMGTSWEIFEFTMDSLLDFSMQRFGLVDTMWDLILDSLGGLFASIVGYIYLKREEPFLFSREIKRFALYYFTKKG